MHVQNNWQEDEEEEEVADKNFPQNMDLMSPTGTQIKRTNQVLLTPFLMQTGSILILNDIFTFIVLRCGLRLVHQGSTQEKTTRDESGATKLLTRAGKTISSESLCTGTLVGARAVHTLGVGAAPLGPVGAFIKICTWGSKSAGSRTAISNLAGN